MAHYVRNEQYMHGSPRWPADVKRIVDAFASRGHTISASDAEWAWEMYSETMAAGWMVMDNKNEDEIFALCLPYLQKEK